MGFVGHWPHLSWKKKGPDPYGSFIAAADLVFFILMLYFSLIPQEVYWRLIVSRGENITRGALVPNTLIDFGSELLKLPLTEVVSQQKWEEPK